MINVLYNTDFGVTRDSGSVKITINGLYLKAEVTDKDGNVEGFDAIQAMRSYNSYTLVHYTGSVKVFRKVTKSEYRFLDLNRLGVANRLDFQKICQLYGDWDVLQVDTGLITPTSKDIVVRVFSVHKDNIKVEADCDYTIGEFSSKALEYGDHPRFNLWDSYALQVVGRELKANRKGTVIDGDFATPLPALDGPAYMEIGIKKYKGNFEEALTRDEDTEEVMIHSSAGLLNATRVRLKNGAAKVRFYPLGYTGEVKIKLGRKWYEVWNEYNLILGESK
jgi:hypothetical protein